MRNPVVRRAALVVSFVILAAGCGASGGSSETGSASPTSATAEATTTPTTAPQATTTTTSAGPTVTAAPTTTTEPAPALVTEADALVLNWAQVHPGYDTDGGQIDEDAASTASAEGAGDDDVRAESDESDDDAEEPDHYFRIHTDNEADGFYFALQLYTTWGQAWSGETGVFEISCIDERTDTGICVAYDPDGNGPETDIGLDYQTTGTVVIRQLDDNGYDIHVNGLTFSDGTTFAPFRVSGP